jgi:hypothetical protein
VTGFLRPCLVSLMFIAACTWLWRVLRCSPRGMPVAGFLSGVFAGIFISRPHPAVVGFRCPLARHLRRGSCASLSGGLVVHSRLHLAFRCPPARCLRGGSCAALSGVPMVYSRLYLAAAGFRKAPL